MLKAAGIFHIANDQFSADRKLSEQIIVEFEDGTTVEITVNRIDNSSVRLHFNAPETIKINRSERLPIDDK